MDGENEAMVNIRINNAIAAMEQLFGYRTVWKSNVIQNFVPPESSILS